MIVLIIDNYTYVVFDEENNDGHMVILLLYQHYDGASANALQSQVQCLTSYSAEKQELRGYQIWYWEVTSRPLGDH